MQKVLFSFIIIIMIYPLHGSNPTPMTPSIPNPPSQNPLDDEWSAEGNEVDSFNSNRPDRRRNNSFNISSVRSFSSLTEQSNPEISIGHEIPNEISNEMPNERPDGCINSCKRHVKQFFNRLGNKKNRIAPEN